ncbi:unnamed protein product [Rotaria sp. Silwood1]|nr:unnamed protein product [Rotaria sp. Silwood1]
MTSSYYPITTDHFFDNTQLQSITPMSHYSSYQITNTTQNNYHNDNNDDEDDDLEELRTAALKTLYSNKRKNTYDHSPIHRNSRSSSRSYSSSSSSSRSSYSRSSRSRSYSSSSLSSISSNSLDRNDKDYRFEIKTKQTIADIDERFPQDIPNNNNNDDDTLIVNCPIQDDDLLLRDEQQTIIINHSKEEQISKKISNHNKLSSKDIKRQKIEDIKKSSSIQEQPVSITVKLNSDNFDLRQLIKKRRTNESLPNNNNNNQRIVHILPKDNQTNVHKTIHDRVSSRQTDKNQTLKKYHKH